MNFDYLNPVSESLLTHIKMQANKTLGQCIDIYTTKNGFPNLENKKIAIIGVDEDRASVNNIGAGSDLNEIRKELYQLYPGNWPISVVDLGNISKGNSIEDTYFALGELLTYLIKSKINKIKQLGQEKSLTKVFKSRWCTIKAIRNYHSIFYN